MASDEGSYTVIDESPIGISLLHITPQPQKNSQENTLFEIALSRTGYGKFHFLLFLLLGGTYSAIAMEMTVVSFVIPAAKCDFGMSSQDGGILNAAPMLGMTLGSYFWGFLADMDGRRWVLGSSLLMGGLAGIVSSLAQYFFLFVLLRFLNGFALAGALSICLPYLGEFQPMKKRKRILCWMELAWTAGIIALPCLAWLVIPINMRIESKYFTYDSWNAFVFASALPCIFLGVWTWTFPESPKFLYEMGETEKTVKVLKYMYAMNTGQPEENFEAVGLEGKCISILGNESHSTKIEKRKKDFASFLKNLGSIASCLTKPPHRKNTFLTCFIGFCLTASYYTLMMWFPELFSRFEAYRALHPAGNSSHISVCDVSSVYVQTGSQASSSPQHCQTNINTHVYLNTLIVGLACIPTSIWLPVCVNRLGPKFFMIFCVTVAGFVALGMYFVTSSTQNLILSCLFESLTSLAVVTFYMVLTEIFPTNVRVMATGLSISFGRLGALLGNLSFGYLIDLNCIVPIAMFSAMLFCTAIACIFLPVKMKKKVTYGSTMP